ncbi:MAG TPA: hypothetical protein DEV98_07750, partial [Clostridiales bacterium]|nr:hypothetical protein [Clostridiales bacterium]
MKKIRNIRTNNSRNKIIQNTLTITKLFKTSTIRGNIVSHPDTNSSHRKIFVRQLFPELYKILI